MTKFFTIFLSLCFISSLLNAQENTKVGPGFKASSTINNQTVKTVKKGSLEFGLQHRFGLITIDEDVIKNFFGMDLSSNIRFDFTYGITDNFHIGVGRTKYKKNYDLFFKYHILNQDKSGPIPIHLALYSNMAIMSDDFPNTENYYETDSITPFTYAFSDRFSYNTQLIISRKFNHWFSFQCAPQLVFQNIVDSNETNYRMAIPFTARFKVAMFSSILAEYSHVLNKPANHFDPMSIAFEVSTASHVFQITLSNTNKILGQSILYAPGVNVANGEFYLGFNMIRRFYIKK